jgi:hypothetical protein
MPVLAPMRTRLLLCALLALIAVAPVAAAAATAQIPQGVGGGVVTVDGDRFTDLADVEEHLGCAFQIGLAGFAEDAAPVVIAFRLDGPRRTVADEVLLEDEIELAPGEQGFGASRSYTLPADQLPSLPHGVNVKLTVGSGLDSSSKVFVVRGCGATGPTAATGSTNGPSGPTDPSGHTGPTVVTTPAGSGGPAGPAGPAGPSGPVAGGPSPSRGEEPGEPRPVAGGAPGVPATTTTLAVLGESGPRGGDGLPFTGWHPAALLPAAALLLLAGLVTLWAARSRQLATARRQPPGTPPGTPR